MRPKKPQRVLDARKSGNPILATEGTGENDVEMGYTWLIRSHMKDRKPAMRDEVR